ncbi:hypothetical protein FIBSPDRAFT_851572 [Athelia psychrophila]|uniref:Uncharacterized protein n=1 Tax=Athelia psychrophila TaxID=1759441 RepID=A0A166SAA3_9AGAM|nr:hypothetical protein FIBSPDRAFT_851572 [Fibularhizoctonia sp. CBS 109695]
MSSPQTTHNTDQDEGKSRFPLLLSYVTIKIDFVKSVEILEDDEATAAAQDAVSKVYIGYLSFVCMFLSACMGREWVERS